MGDNFNSYIDGKDLKKLFKGAVNYLILNKEEINALNVFPVPDGDTGTNMSLTAKSALKQIDMLDDDASASEVSSAASMGALMGARGNSGVILSQLLRGFAEGIKSDEVDLNEMAHAFKKASEMTYKAVMKPIEGTILTVGKDAGEYAIRNYKTAKNHSDLLRKVIIEANRSLEDTPNKLKVLKEAGVVDAGAKGLVTMLEGAYKAMTGEDIKDLTDDSSLKKKEQKKVDLGPADESLEFGYCTEFIINTEKEAVEDLRGKLSPLGDCLLVVGGGGDGFIKVHVHTNHPGKALEYGCELGLLQDIKIDNMRYQHREVLFDEEDVEAARKVKKEKKPYAFILVSMGKGMSTLFKSLGVDYIVNGGQTMNPSTEDFIKAIESQNAENIYIIPNNSNIILTAKQAGEMSDKNVIVIPTKSIPQGVAALLAFNEDKDAKENAEVMNEALAEVIDAQITYAVRDTNMNQKDVKKGDIIGLAKKEIISSGNEINEVAINTIEELINEDISVITLYYGEDVDIEDANELKIKLEEKYTDVDIDLIDGTQPIYYYIISMD